MWRTKCHGVCVRKSGDDSGGVVKEILEENRAVGGRPSLDCCSRSWATRSTSWLHVRLVAHDDWEWVVVTSRWWIWTCLADKSGLNGFGKIVRSHLWIGRAFYKNWNSASLTPNGAVECVHSHEAQSLRVRNNVDAIVMDLDSYARTPKHGEDPTHLLQGFQEISRNGVSCRIWSLLSTPRDTITYY